jgi:hypothetical protein
MMSQCENPVGRRHRLDQADFRELASDPVAQCEIFLHREAMPGWQRENEPIGVVSSQGLEVYRIYFYNNNLTSYSGSHVVMVQRTKNA